MTYFMCWQQNVSDYKKVSVCAILAVKVLTISERNSNQDNVFCYIFLPEYLSRKYLILQPDTFLQGFYKEDKHSHNILKIKAD